MEQNVIPLTLTKIPLELNCVGRINGQLLTVHGMGEGTPKKGQFRLGIEFSAIPEGYSVSTAALWTCCSSPSFAIEQNGAFNMLTLSQGKYKCERRFDFGKYGAYDYNYELRLSDDQSIMKATGIIEGNLNLPDVRMMEQSFSEIMMPISKKEIASFVTSKFVDANGKEIPVKATGKYTALGNDEAWGCSERVIQAQKTQIRTSFFRSIEVNGNKLAIQYATVVKGIDMPAISLEEFDVLVEQMN